MSDYPEDIYTEPTDQDGDTLKNLSLLVPKAGISIVCARIRR